MVSGKFELSTGMATTGTCEVEFPETGLRYIVEKGSIAVDGISLTVAAHQGVCA